MAATPSLTEVSPKKQMKMFQKYFPFAPLFLLPKSLEILVAKDFKSFTLDHDLACYGAYFWLIWLRFGFWSKSDLCMFGFIWSAKSSKIAPGCTSQCQPLKVDGISNFISREVASVGFFLKGGDIDKYPILILQTNPCTVNQPKARWPSEIRNFLKTENCPRILKV